MLSDLLLIYNCSLNSHFRAAISLSSERTVISLLARLKGVLKENNFFWRRGGELEWNLDFLKKMEVVG